MVKIWEYNGTEEIGLVTPTPDGSLIMLLHCFRSQTVCLSPDIHPFGKYCTSLVLTLDADHCPFVINTSADCTIKSDITRLCVSDKNKVTDACHQHVLLHVYISCVFIQMIFLSTSVWMWNPLRLSYVRELVPHRFRWWLFAISVPSHYQNQWWNIVNWTLRNKCSQNLNKKIQPFSCMKMMSVKCWWNVSVAMCNKYDINNAILYMMCCNTLHDLGGRLV